MITYFTVLPMFVGFVTLCWWGLLFAIAGQVVGLLIWTQLHEVDQKQDEFEVNGLDRVVQEIENVLVSREGELTAPPSSLEEQSAPPPGKIIDNP